MTIIVLLGFIDCLASFERFSLFLSLSVCKMCLRPKYKGEKNKTGKSIQSVKLLNIWCYTMFEIHA